MQVCQIDITKTNVEYPIPNKAHFIIGHDDYGIEFVNQENVATFGEKSQEVSKIAQARDEIATLLKKNSRDGRGPIKLLDMLPLIQHTEGTARKGLAKLGEKVVKLDQGRLGYRWYEDLSIGRPASNYGRSQSGGGNSLARPEESPAYKRQRSRVVHQMAAVLGVDIEEEQQQEEDQNPTNRPLS